MRLKTSNPILEFAAEGGKIADSLSAVLFVEDSLWLASDESTSVERLTTDDGSKFKHHQSFSLDDLILLPARGTDFDQEVDIEGMDYQNSHLWLVGSHSIKRKKVEKEDAGDSKKKIKKLAKTEVEGNRFILARIPLITHEGSNAQELVASTHDPQEPGRHLQTAQLDGDSKSNALVNAIRNVEQDGGDQHLARFLSIPGKDNGFDIEGLAVAGDRVFMGLRGPVLRGWAIILEVNVSFKAPSRLKLRDTGPDGKKYKKHFLDLGGLGIRDLCIDGDDMLILAGPTMNLDGPVAVFRWQGAMETTGEELVFADELKRLFLVPHGDGTDHAEGMTLIPESPNPRQVLIVYDSPGQNRKVGARAVKADVFDLP